MKNLSKVVNTVIVGDVLDTLRKFPKNSVDMTITSPPYNKSKISSGWLVNNPQYAHSGDHLPENEYQSWQIKILRQLYRITKPGGSLFYNHKLRWRDGNLIHPMSWITSARWHLRQEIVWDRGLAANMRGWRFWQVDERLYWLYKPENANVIGTEMRSKHAKLSSIWRLRPASRMEEHPAPFPLELPTRAIYSLLDSETNKVVLDPFCGTGTSLVAAKLLGHSFIGVDISPTYVEYTRQRVENAELERDQLTEELAKHIIDDSFQDRKKRGTVSWPLRPKTENDTLLDNGNTNIGLPGFDQAQTTELDVESN